MTETTAFFDGGFSATKVLTWGFVVFSSDQVRGHDFGRHKKHDYSKKLSSYDAEWYACLKLLQYLACAIGFRTPLQVFGDCRGIIAVLRNEARKNWIKGHYGYECWELSQNFRLATFRHVNRKHNSIANRLCNIALIGDEERKAVEVDMLLTGLSMPTVDERNKKARIT